MTTKKYEATFSVGDSYVQIQAEEGKEPVARSTGIFTTDELAAVQCMVQVVKCLSAGISFQAYFNPTVSSEEDNELVKCRWSRAGVLKLEGITTKRFLHAENVAQAIERRRVFTCTRRVFRECPKTRGK
jgi:hypothetical protein